VAADKSMTEEKVTQLIEGIIVEADKDGDGQVCSASGLGERRAVSHTHVARSGCDDPDPLALLVRLWCFTRLEYPQCPTRPPCLTR
jgi:hypothetical protein